LGFVTPWDLHAIRKNGDLGPLLTLRKHNPDNPGQVQLEER
jgi:hypothetical protein